MRDYTRIDKYIDELQDDVYEQPTSDGHLESIHTTLNDWVISKNDVLDVVDFGCGRGESIEFLRAHGRYAAGVTIGPDYGWLVANRPHLQIVNEDMHFTSFADEATDLIFCRHALEHSYMPLILLKEFHRITKKYLIIVVPPHTVGVVGDNHYSILNQAMWERLFDLAGFSITEYQSSLDPVIEHKWLLEKK